MTLDDNINIAGKIIARSKFALAFTGAGISVESGIPPFRGPTGLWSKYDPQILDLFHFYSFPEESWPIIKEIFYDFWEKADPNPAHTVLAQLEQLGILKGVITQNIDNLHQKAGSNNVWEFHGTLNSLTCVECNFKIKFSEDLMDKLPPSCPECGELLKPDFIFFGERIPEHTAELSFQAALNADVVIVVGTKGEVMPACQIPFIAKENGAKIIEINVEPSNFTKTVSDVFLEGNAGEILPKLLDCIKSILGI